MYTVYGVAEYTFWSADIQILSVGWGMEPVRG